MGCCTAKRASAPPALSRSTSSSGRVDRSGSESAGNNPRSGGLSLAPPLCFEAIIFVLIDHVFFLRQLLGVEVVPGAGIEPNAAKRRTL